MWMMGYNESEDFNLTDSFTGRKLRSLVPHPPPCATSATTDAATTNPPYLGHFHGTDLFALNHHLANMAEQNKRPEFNTQQVVVSSRWNPTPEQLQTLEELYRRGTRTPSADQIQTITAQLRRYGKIEGKNVFYWFQNHKARERQKRRRQLESAPTHDEQYHDNESIERKESGANRTNYEVEQTKNWAHSTNCSTLSEKTASMRRGAKAAGAECRTDGWVQFDERELQQHRRNFVERNATWQSMQYLSSSPPINNNTTTTTTINSTAVTATSTTALAASDILSSMDPKLNNKTQDLNTFITPYRQDLNHLIRFNGGDRTDGSGFVESPTLQLFPLRSSEGGKDSVTRKEADISVTDMDGNFAPNYQFFEFLPLKN